MRLVSICYPHEFSVVEDTTVREGTRQIVNSDGVDFSVELLRAGEQLNAAGTSLRIVAEPSPVGGLFNLRVKPNSSGALPRNFFKPFRFLYSFQTTPTSSEWVGQSDKGVKEYKKFVTLGPQGPFEGKYALNKVFASYKGQLLFLGETNQQSGSTYERTVKLWRLDETTGNFVRMKVFDELLVDRFDSQQPVDANEQAAGASPAEQLQSGSPHAFVFDGFLYVGYRVVNRNTESNFCVLWRTEDEDLQEWELVDQVLVNDSFGVDYKNFRLRFATDGSTILFAWFATGELDLSIPPKAPSFGAVDKTIFPKDFRTYVSFDGGFTFNTRQNKFKNIVETFPNKVESTVNSSNIHSLFVPIHAKGTNEEDLRVDVKFDLYFDKNIGSYVILKAGDPRANSVPHPTFTDTSLFGGEERDNDFYLMGIKTVDGDLFNWELVLQLPIDYRITGISGNDTDAFDESVGSDPTAARSRHSYMINDVGIVEDEGVHTLFLSVVEPLEIDGSSNLYSGTGVTISEFTFLRDTVIPPGFYRDLFAYGTKSHENILFFSSNINVEYSALVSVGNRMYDVPNAVTSVIPVGWDSIMATKWRNQIVASAHRKIPNTPSNTHNFYAIISPWSNMGETIPYQHSYCRWHQGMMGTPATGLLTITSGNNALNNETVKIGLPSNQVEYTFQTVLSPAGGVNNVLIGVDRDASIANLIAAITLTGTPGTDYGSGTVIHPTVTASTTANAGEMAVESFSKSRISNTITTEETLTHGSFGSIRLLGGSDGFGAFDGSGTTPWSLAFFGTTATYSYDFANGWNVFSAPNGFSGTDAIWALLPDKSGTREGRNVAARASYQGRQNIKMKFTFQASGISIPSEWIDICGINVTGRNGEGIDWVLRLTGDGNLELFDDGPSRDTFATAFDLSKSWEIMLQHGSVSGFDKTSILWAREYGTFEWTAYGGEINANKTPGGVRFGTVGVGILDTNVDGAVLKIGDVFVGTPSNLYRPTFENAKKYFPNLIEGTGKSNDVANGFADFPYTANPVSLMGNEIELDDGSLIRFTGGNVSRAEAGFNYNKSLSKNSQQNLMNGFPASIYDFTNHYDAVNGNLVVFRNELFKDVDCFSLFNIVGVSDFVLESGTFDEVTRTFTSSTTQAYDIPYSLLDISATDGPMAVFDNDVFKFQPSELVGYTVLIHDGTVYESQLIVVENFDNVIEFDIDVPSLAGKTVRLMTPVGSFNVPDAIGIGGHSHFGLTLNGPATATFMGLGEVVFGSLVELTEFVNRVVGRTRGESQVVESMEGFRFPENPNNENNLLEEIDLEMDGLRLHNNEFDTVKDVFFTLFNRETHFPIIFTFGGGQEIVTQLGVMKEPQNSGDDYGFSMKVPITLQNWTVVPNSDFDNEPPVIVTASLSKTEPEVSEVVTFQATAFDPEGATLTYSWDFGDTNTNTGPSVTHSYSSEGEFTVTLDVSDGEKITTKTFLVVVQAAGIDTYELTGGAGPHATTATINIEVTAKDAAAAVVTGDSETWVRFDVIPASIVTAPAVGSIVAIAPGSIVDTDTFFLDDGTNTLTFEFEKVPPGAPGTVDFAVDISTATTAIDVATAMVAAINLASPFLINLTADNVGGTSATVTITNTVNGPIGNVGTWSTTTTMVITQPSGGILGDGFDADGDGLYSDGFEDRVVQLDQGVATIPFRMSEVGTRVFTVQDAFGRQLIFTITFT